MDPFSILAGVAGIAAAGGHLSAAIFSLIVAIHDAPKEMKDMARGVSELSLVLRELRRVLKDGTGLYRPHLLRLVKASTRRIRGLLDEVQDLVDHSKGLKSAVRVILLFRTKARSAKLVGKIETLKGTVQLMATTMLLAIS